MFFETLCFTIKKHFCNRPMLSKQLVLQGSRFFWFSIMFPNLAFYNQKTFLWPVHALKTVCCTRFADFLVFCDCPKPCVLQAENTYVVSPCSQKRMFYKVCRCASFWWFSKTLCFTINQQSCDRPMLSKQLVLQGSRFFLVFDLFWNLVFYNKKTFQWPAQAGILHHPPSPPPTHPPTITKARKRGASAAEEARKCFLSWARGSQDFSHSTFCSKIISLINTMPFRLQDVPGNWFPL